MIKYFGNAGHFIGGNNCRFHLTTKVGDFLVSTVGEYIPFNGKGIQEIGNKRTYETMVFRTEKFCGCGCGMPTTNGTEVAFMGYNNAKDANNGHGKMVKKFSKKEEMKI